ncbi:MAG: phosphatase PAP2 family protein [Bacilli bacterium]|nr:phosphatase PAP2 family protein [Bacilli bacterium]
MNKEVNKIKNFWWIPLGGILIVGIILGFFFDLSTAIQMYTTNNLFGTAIEYIGSVPGYTLVGFAGPLLYLAFRYSEKKWVKYLGFAAFFAIPLASGLVLGYDVFYDKLKYLGLLGGAVVVLGLDALMFTLFRHAKPKEALKDAFILAISFAVTFILVFALKHIIERPRYIYVIDHPDAFRPLFDLSSNIKDADKDLLNSFPSGHCAFAGTFILFPILCKHSRRLKYHEGGIFIMACLWIAIVMLGRMISGYHYLSDTSFGALIGVVISFLTNFLSQFIKPTKKEETTNG